MIKMLLVGLGNPGKEYEMTRHNFGVRVVEAFVKNVGEEELKARGITYLLPTLNMNDSGRPVAEFLRQRPLTPGNILLVHDELELPLGEWKFLEGGSAKGHNGVRSVQDLLGTQDIPRLRLGIGRPALVDDSGEASPVADYVLQNFSSEEEKIVERVIQEASEALAVRLLA